MYEKQQPTHEKTRQILIDAREKVRSTNISLLAFYGISLLLVTTFMSIMIASSSKLSSTYLYYSGAQMIVILFSTIHGIAFMSSVIVFFVDKPLLGRMIQIVGTISFSGATGVAIALVLISLLQVKCGYFIGHSGEADGGYITNEMENDKNFPSCDNIEQSGFSMQSVLAGKSLGIISMYCVDQKVYGTQFKECVSQDTLVVEQWSTVFTLEIVGIVIGIITLFCIQISFGHLSSRFNKQVQQIKEALLANI